jgi:hypothetical protein
MLGDKSGAWIWSTPELSDSSQRMSATQLMINNFFPAGFRADG